MRPPLPVWRRWRRIGRSTLLCGSLAAALATNASPSEASAKKLNEWIQRWLGNPPIASGGTRGTRGGPPPPEICLLHPWLQPDLVPNQANLALPRPLLATTTPLRLLSLEQNGGRRFEAKPPPNAIGGGTWMAWPNHWPSLEPGRSYRLTLTPATGNSNPTIVLQAGTAEAFEKVRNLQEQLGSDPSAWERKIQAMLTSAGTPSSTERALAAQLLFSLEAPPSPRLARLRLALQRNNCSPSPSPARPQGGDQ